MMKGHMQDGKFHPHNQTKGVTRKKRLDYNDPDLIKHSGVKLEKYKLENGHKYRLARDLKHLSQIALDTNAYVDRHPLAGNFDVGDARKFLVNRGHSVKEIDDYFISQGLLSHQGREFLAKREKSKRERKARDQASKTKLENRASVGIRAYTKEFKYEGMPLVIEIHTHHPFGKYLVEPYWNTYPLTENQLEVSNALGKERFDKFNDAKRFVEKKFGLDLELDKKDSNDYQTWEENIKQTDHILPFDRKFWALPETEKDDIRPSESTEEFLKRIGKV